MGIPLEELERVIKERDGIVTDYEVMEENWQALTVFLRCSTQWKVAPMGGRLGLDYVSLKVVMDLMDIESTNELFWKVQQIERGALKEWSKRA